MQDQSNDGLVKRLERLECSNRRLKPLGMVALAVIGTMGAAQNLPQTFNTLTANQIVAQGIAIVDSNGKLRVAIGANPDTDQGGISVYQRDSVGRAGIGIGEDGSSSAAGFNDSLGMLRAAVGSFGENLGSGTVASDANRAIRNLRFERIAEWFAWSSVKFKALASVTLIRIIFRLLRTD